MSDLPIVREIEARSLLNKSGISDYAVNGYLDRQHKCRYCYAALLTHSCPHAEAGGDLPDVRINAAATLERQAKRMPGGRASISSACDP